MSDRQSICRRAAAAVVLTALATTAGTGIASAQQKKPAHKPSTAQAKPAKAAQAQRGAADKRGKAASADTIDMTALQTQVMLDRAGYSPGQIDGRTGSSTTRAFDAFTHNGG